MSTKVFAVGRPELPPLEMPDRFRHDITYFCTQAGERGAPESLPADHWWVGLADARTIYNDGVIRVVSPLDSSSTAELEISEDHETWLQWMIANGVEQIRLE
jgi:hypothetical protein